MSTMKDQYRSLKLSGVVLGSVLAASVMISSELQAQALEEIVVTAQRRVQTLQDVPISVNVYSGELIDRQGFKNLDDLARYSATVHMSEGVSGQNTTIRGFGTSGASMTLQSATPLFVDGIHFGDLAMVKNAFLDTERMEVLMGPQPLHFGMDATAGAFNLTSKRPTQQFEGDVHAEFGNDGKREISGAFGGPITDTLAFRVAAAQDSLAGLVKNRVDHKKFPHFDSLGGRVSLLWNPNDKITVYTKLDYNQQRNGGELIGACIAEGDPTGYAETPINGYTANTDHALAQMVFVPASHGGLSNADRLNIVQLNPKYRDKSCFDDEYGISRGGPWIAPTITNIVKSGLATPFDGYVSAAAVQDAFHRVKNPANLFEGIDGRGSDGFDHIDAYNTILDVTYRLDNGISINSQTAYVDYQRMANADSGYQPFADSNQHREIDHTQHSQQIRIEGAPEGYDYGAMNLNFMVGGFYQYWDKDVIVSNVRAILRRGQRTNDLWEDAEFKSAFWGLDMKFLDQQLSLQVGGRYSDVQKEVYLNGYGAALIFDAFPCDHRGTDSNPDTCSLDPNFKRVHPNLTTFSHIDPITGRGGFGSRPERVVRIDSPRIYLSNVNMDNLWTQQLWNVRYPVPLNYRGGQEIAVGLTAPALQNAAGPWGDCERCKGAIEQDDSDYSSQIVLSLTPDAFEGRHTFYGKYVEGFKASVTDTGTSTIPSNLNDMYFSPEYATSWEIGARGTLFDSRLRYGVTGFMTSFRDLQSQAAVAQYNPDDIIEQQGISLNAGKQKVDGIELNLDWAATHNLVLNLSGSLMNARFKDFDGTGCIDSEIIAASINALENPAGRSAAEIALATTILGNMGPLAATLPTVAQIPPYLLKNGGCRLEDTPEFAAGDSTVGEALTYNREGFQPGFAPDYKIVLGATYTLPVFGNYEVMLNAQGYIEDSKIVIPDEFDRSRMYNSGHWDVNMQAGFGPQDGTWMVAAYVRNLMEDRMVFNQEYDLSRAGIVFSDDRDLSKASYTNYGVRFEYKFR